VPSFPSIGREIDGLGFLTPPELFYVRNHGAVPQVLDEEIVNWKVSLEGYRSPGETISLQELEWWRIQLP